MRDVHVRPALHARLKRRFAHDVTTIVLDEFGLNLGRVRADVVAVNGHLHGFEIKAAADDLSRLPRQIEAYSKVFDFATIVTAEKHLRAAQKMLPDWWGIQVAAGSPVELTSIRAATANPEPDCRTLVQLLWRDEALALLNSRDAAQGVVSKPRRFVWARVCETFTTEEIGAAVRACIKARADRSSQHVPAARRAKGGGSCQSSATLRKTQALPGSANT